MVLICGFGDCQNSGTLSDLSRAFTEACLRCGSTNSRVKKMEGAWG